MDDHSDETLLIRAAQRGDLAAFGALVERHQGSVRACLAVRMNHAPDAEDLAQEALLIAFRKLPQIDPALPLGPWLRGIALHLLANHRRKFRAIPIGLNDELQALLDAQLDADFHAGRESERMHALRECLDELDGPARALVRERYAEGATLDEDEESSRSVKNRAAHAVTESHGALVGAGWTGGRWPGKRALEFRSLGDRLRFTLPGAHRAITLMTWVRVDSLPNDYNSLLMPSHYQAGSLHWTLERGGELRLTLRNTDTQGNGAHLWDGPVSGPAVSNMDFGRWLFLATTYDSATGIVAHYRDGQRSGIARFAHRLPAVLGTVEFGNWGADATDPDAAWTKTELPNQRLRNFVGRVDELAVLARAMSAEEIARLYEIGKP